MRKGTIWERWCYEIKSIFIMTINVQLTFYKIYVVLSILVSVYSHKYGANYTTAHDTYNMLHTTNKKSQMAFSHSWSHYYNYYSYHACQVIIHATIINVNKLQCILVASFPINAYVAIARSYRPYSQIFNVRFAYWKHQGALASMEIWLYSEHSLPGIPFPSW